MLPAKHRELDVTSFVSSLKRASSRLRVKVTGFLYAHRTQLRNHSPHSTFNTFYSVIHPERQQAKPYPETSSDQHKDPPHCWNFLHDDLHLCGNRSIAQS